MGQVPGEVVAAAFGAFNPAVVVPAVVHGWTLTDATTIEQARTEGAVASCDGILGDEPAGLDRAIQLLQQATGCARRSVRRRPGDGPVDRSALGVHGGRHRHPIKLRGRAGAAGRAVLQRRRGQAVGWPPGDYAVIGVLPEDGVGPGELAEQVTAALEGTTAQGHDDDLGGIEFLDAAEARSS